MGPIKSSCDHHAAVRSREAHVNFSHATARFISDQDSMLLIVEVDDSNVCQRYARRNRVLADDDDDDDEVDNSLASDTSDTSDTYEQDEEEEEEESGPQPTYAPEEAPTGSYTSSEHLASLMPPSLELVLGRRRLTAPIGAITTLSFRLERSVDLHGRSHDSFDVRQTSASWSEKFTVIRVTPVTLQVLRTRQIMNDSFQSVMVVGAVISTLVFLTRFYALTAVIGSMITPPDRSSADDTLKQSRSQSGPGAEEE